MSKVHFSVFDLARVTLPSLALSLLVVACTNDAHRLGGDPNAADEGAQGGTSAGAEGGGAAASSGVPGAGSGGSAGAGGAARSGGSDAQPTTEGVQGGTSNGSCSYGGASYASGQSFPAGDACNNCGCVDGVVSCTHRSCLAEGGPTETGATHEAGTAEADAAGGGDASASCAMDPSAYDNSCSTDSDCAIVPRGDPCKYPSDAICPKGTVSKRGLAQYMAAFTSLPFNTTGFNTGCPAAKSCCRQGACVVQSTFGDNTVCSVPEADAAGSGSTDPVSCTVQGITYPESGNSCCRCDRGSIACAAPTGCPLPGVGADAAGP